MGGLVYNECNPFYPGYYETWELKKMLFKRIGENVRIAKNCTIVGLENIEIGNNVRIDGYTTILAHTGYLTMGNNIHVAAYCFINAGAGVILEDFSGYSQGVRIYSRSDDFSGKSMTNPTVPPQYCDVVEAKITIGRHTVVGSGTVILPGCLIGEGCAIGALSLLDGAYRGWGIYAGIPAKRIRDRSSELLLYEKEVNKS